MERQLTILVVEDDSSINDLLTNILQKAGYNVRSAYSGTEAQLCLEHYQYDTVLLDLMLPGVHGEQLISEIHQKQTMPILVLSAKTAQETKIEVLKLGADDFISKPFDINEVLARVEANIRRYKQFSAPTPQNNILTFKELELNSENHTATINQNDLSLTYREFSILELLLKNPNKVFTRANIFEAVWGSDFFGDENTVNVHISHLRSKIANLSPNKEYIQTVWGIGFKLKE